MSSLDSCIQMLSVRALCNATRLWSPQLVPVQAWRTLFGQALSRSQACRAADLSRRWESPPCGGLCPAAGSSLPRSPPTHPCHCHVRFKPRNFWALLSPSPEHRHSWSSLLLSCKGSHVPQPLSPSIPCFLGLLDSSRCLAPQAPAAGIGVFLHDYVLVLSHCMPACACKAS